MEKLKLIYEGKLRNRLIHLRSGSEIFTDAPVDNNGQGAKFSPTDLLAASLASCMLTIIGIAAEKNGFTIDQATTAEVEKHMQSNPRKLKQIKIRLFFKGQKYSQDQQRIIENAARNCPVALSLSTEVKQDLEFIYA